MPLNRALSCAELRRRCAEAKVSISGKKDQMFARLADGGGGGGGSPVAPAPAPAPAPSGGSGGGAVDETQMPLSTNLSGAELRRRCVEANVPTSGNKDQMFARLADGGGGGGGSPVAPAPAPAPAPSGGSGGGAVDETQMPLSTNLSGAELRRRCVEANLPTSGNKDQMFDRLGKKKKRKEPINGTFTCSAQLLSES